MCKKTQLKIFYRWRRFSFINIRRRCDRVSQILCLWASKRNQKTETVTKTLRNPLTSPIYICLCCRSSIGDSGTRISEQDDGLFSIIMMKKKLWWVCYLFIIYDLKLSHFNSLRVYMWDFNNVIKGFRAATHKISVL